MMREEWKGKGEKMKRGEKSCRECIGDEEHRGSDVIRGHRLSRAL